MTEYYFLYCVASAYTDQKGKKLGCTSFPVERLLNYSTGDCPGLGLDKRYDGIWQVDAQSRKELLRWEKRMHHYFHSKRMRNEKGMWTEWFEVTYEQVAEFLQSQKFVIRPWSLEEVKERVSSPPAPPVLLSVEDEFFATFLSADQVPRSIQYELWDAWEAVLSGGENYRGILQWPTGTGKTIALLTLFFLSAKRCKDQGEIFRGLLIAPKNDILDSIMHHIRKLSKFGIVVCEGHHACLSSLEIPQDVPVLITTTHASLVKAKGWEKLPPITHFHYDEVHRSTGEKFYSFLQPMLLQWATKYLTGTSATPETCDPSQHEKIAELFGSPLSILHRCDVVEAIREGWIATPRFSVSVMSNDLDRLTIVEKFVHIVMESMEEKQNQGKWQGGKVIAYLPTQKEVLEACKLAKEKMPDSLIYSAVESKEYRQDDPQFVKDPADGRPRILFACERYREGSDVHGLEMTCILMGNTLGVHVLLQVAGRALRNDYEGKEGWCVIVRPSEKEETVDSVWDSIVVKMMEFLEKKGTVTGKEEIPSKETIQSMVEKYFGTLVVNDRVYNVEETVDRLQSMYARTLFHRAHAKEKYDVIRNLNKDLNLLGRTEYLETEESHPKFLPNPKDYFKDCWVSWYHFCGVDTSRFPPTKQDWIRLCKEKDGTTWETYQQNCLSTEDMPPNPGEMYEDFTNFDQEFGNEQECVW